MILVLLKVRRLRDVFDRRHWGGIVCRCTHMYPLRVSRLVDAVVRSLLIPRTTSSGGILTGLASLAIPPLVFFAQGFGLELVPVSIDTLQPVGIHVSIAVILKLQPFDNMTWATYSSACFGSGSSVVK